MVIMGMRVLMWTKSQFLSGFAITGKLLFHSGCTSSGRCGVGMRNSIVFLTRIHSLGSWQGLKIVSIIVVDLEIGHGATVFDLGALCHILFILDGIYKQIVLRIM